eukprot:1738137-Rhodomonas_salina.1
MHHPHTTKSRHNTTTTARHQRAYSKTHLLTRPADWRRPRHVTSLISFRQHISSKFTTMTYLNRTPSA